MSSPETPARDAWATVVGDGGECYDRGMKILVIEDDAETADYIATGLRENGHAVEIASDGRDGLFLAAGGAFDLLIVDRMLPRMDGLAIIKTLRGAGTKTPALFLSTLSGIDDRVDGLNAGGDDYLIKPFAFAELLARVNALGRRPVFAAAQTELCVGDLKMDLIARNLRRDGREIDLQPREWQLLEYLLRNVGKVVTRTMLLERVWDFHFDPRTNVVETHISRLRQKVDRGFSTELIETVRGAGYRIRETR